MKHLPLFLFLACPLTGLADFPVPGDEWAKASAQGWNEVILTDARTTFNGMESSALMVIHQGRLVVDWGDTSTRNNVASMRKALLSGLYGIAWDRGLIDLESTLASLGVNDSEPVLTIAERQATVEHLLRSRSGVFHSSLYDAGWFRNMPAPGSHPPGAFWIYNNWDFNTLGTILEQETGVSIGAAFASEIARPLGMQDFAAEDVSYETRDNLAERFMGNTSDHRLYLFRMSARDLARYGLLYLNRGRWGDTQLLSEAWIDQAFNGVATNFESRRFDTAYGYLWWVDEGDKRRFKIPGETSKVMIGSGARGHYLFIWPRYEMVIVHSTATPRGAGAWDQIARRLLGAPDVQDWQFLPLLELILRAHPQWDGAGDSGDQAPSAG